MLASQCGSSGIRLTTQGRSSLYASRPTFQPHG